MALPTMKTPLSPQPRGARKLEAILRELDGTLQGRHPGEGAARVTLSRGQTVVVRAGLVGGGVKFYRIGMIERTLEDGTVVVRLWMGQRWPRGVRWARKSRRVQTADVIREATPRETTIGHAL